jgi:plastocyanin
MLQPVTRIRMAVCLLALPASAAVRADKTVEVGQFGNSFTSSVVDVSPGETVTWNFHATHTTTSDATTGPEVWDSGILSTGSFSHTFTTPGSYPYYCALHSQPGGTAMNGVVNVVGGAATPTPTRTPTGTRTPTRTPTATPTRTPTVTAPGVTPTPLALVFHTLTPCRVADTRNANGPYGGPALQAGATRVFAIANQCGVPAGARSIAFNVTVTQPAASGYITLFPAGASLPLASTLNYRSEQTRANNAIAPLGAGGALAVFSGQGAGTTHFIIDVTGYFE